MNEKELKDLFEAMEEQGLKPMLCDTPVAVYDGQVPCGAPVMCGDVIEEMATLPKGLLSLNPEFMVSVRGDSMKDVGIETGDMVRVVGGVPVYDGDVVLACIDGEYTVKTYFETDDKEQWLVPQNERYEPILISGMCDVSIVGRVKSVVKPQPRVSARACQRIVRRTRQAPERRVPTEQELAQAIREVAPMVTTRRQWYAVYRALVDRLVVKAEDYDSAIALITAAVSEHKCPPTVRELQRMAVDSFTKAVALWREDSAPVQGKRFKDYVAIAERTLELLG